MKENTVIINIPEGYEIDLIKTTKDMVVFKMITFPTWEEIMTNNQNNEILMQCISSRGAIAERRVTHNCNVTDFKACVNTIDQGRKLIAFAKLLVIMDEYNGDWKPDWNNCNMKKHIPVFNHRNSEFESILTYLGCSPIVFKSMNALHNAIRNNAQIFLTYFN